MLIVAISRKRLSSNWVLLSVSGGKPNQIFLNSWIKTYSSLTLSIPALRWRLDDELAKCEHVTGTALFMDDQPLLKSLGQWCVSTSSWDESPWCLLTGLIPLVSEANQECALAPNTCFRVDSIWPKMRAKEGSLKITNREGVAERQHESMQAW